MHLLQEQALQLEAVNSGLQEETTAWADEKVRLEGRVHQLTEELCNVQASAAETLGLQSRIIDLQFENAGLEKKPSDSKSSYQGVCFSIAFACFHAVRQFH